MGLYSYINDNSGETSEIFQKMNDTHVYSGVCGNEEGWRRLYTSPQLSIDTDFDPRNKEEFMRRGAKYSTVGDLIDKSRELSEKRESKDGKDGVKQAFFDQYSRERGGKPHPASKPKKIETDRVVVDLS